MEIPRTKVLSQAERFIEGLKLLADECNMSSVKYTKMGIVITYKFDDSSSVGCGRAHQMAGLIDV